MKRTLVPILVAFGFLAGCTTEAPDPAPSPTTTASMPVVTETPTTDFTEETPPPAPEAEEQAVVTGEYGKEISVGDVAVTITEPKEFQPEAGGFVAYDPIPADWDKFLAVKIKVRNIAPIPLDIMMTSYTLYVGTETGVEITGDTDHAYGFTGDTVINPTRSKEWLAVFAVPDTGKVEFEFNAPPDHFPLIVYGQ